MKIEVVKGKEITGKTIELNIIELIVLATVLEELKQYRDNEALNEPLDKAIGFIGKITTDVQGINSTNIDLFSDELVNYKFKIHYENDTSHDLYTYIWAEDTIVAKKMFFNDNPKATIVRIEKVE